MMVMLFGIKYLASLEEQQKGLVENRKDVHCKAKKVGGVGRFKEQ